ncbi:MAG: glycoside hydrolase family 28 protein [Spirochaetaceae bacterium]|jgi:polygalacturonase|nr:glycoside hydrolase family 28 protein [Spirochaetaceae bacterium]
MYWITDFGGVEGAADNSAAFAAAGDVLRAAGGGTLALGPGVWRTGPVELFSGTTLVLEAGAVLSFIPDMERYPPVRTRWEGVECYAMHPCVFSRGQRDVAVTAGTAGAGRIEGNGAYWWALAREKNGRGARLGAPSDGAAAGGGPAFGIERRLAALNPGYRQEQGGGGGRGSQFLRPPLVQFLDCERVRLEGVTLADAPFWTVHPLYCRDVTLSRLTICNPHDAPNTDGIDIDSCSGVLIEHCVINVGDDGIALKAGSGPDGLRVGKPTSGVRVEHCTVGDGHGGIVIGSETAGGVFDVRVSDCVFKGTDRGVRIKTRRGRGGVIRDLDFRDIVMEGTLCPLVINMYYRCGAVLEDGWFSLARQPVNAETPEIRNVTVRNIRASGCRSSAGFIAGLPESPVRNLSITDCFFSTDEESPAAAAESDMYLGIPDVRTKAFRILNAENPRFENCRIEGPPTPFISE